MAWKLNRFGATAIFVTAALWLVYLSRDNLPSLLRLSPEPVVEVEIPRYDAWGIHDLHELIQVSSIRVQPAFERIDLPVKQQANVKFSFTDVNLTQSLDDLPFETATLIAQSHSTPDASALIIGLATKLERLRDSLPAFAQWASGTGVKFVVSITPYDQNVVTPEQIYNLYAEHNITLTLIESASNATWQDTYVSLLAVLHDHATPHTKWACIMDDDTYFFSMKRVLAMLNKYDASQPYYIGGLSENKETWDRVGYFAYGGAGMFLSMPLLKQLRPYVDDCVASSDAGGDVRISYCITTYSTTKFTWEHYLFQMDLHGDVTGFYEATRERPTSTHHWNSWHHHDMVQVGAVGRVCGNECVLQKYVTTDGWMLTNGFSIVKYSYSEEEEKQFIEGAMEHTWADTMWVIPTSWNYTLAPLKPRDPGKIQYVIERVEEDSHSLTLYYVQRKNGLGQSIVRMIWNKSA